MATDVVAEQSRVDQAARTLATAQESVDGWMLASTVQTLFDNEMVTKFMSQWRHTLAHAFRDLPDLEVALPGGLKYPRTLLGTSVAPALLFVRGEVQASDQLSVAIVGSREASAEALEVAHTVAAGLAERGITIISGLARGIDSAAHQGALSVQGRTIAVIGTGIDQVFPPENAELMSNIADTGAVVSQFPPGMEPSKTSFPSRNSIIAGLARVSLIIAASERSGTRIEMDYALELGRPVLLWKAIVGQQQWAQDLAAANPGVHLVSSIEDIEEFVHR